MSVIRVADGEICGGTTLVSDWCRSLNKVPMGVI